MVDDLAAAVDSGVAHGRERVPASRGGRGGTRVGAGRNLPPAEMEDEIGQPRAGEGGSQVLRRGRTEGALGEALQPPRSVHGLERALGEDEAEGEVVGSEAAAQEL